MHASTTVYCMQIAKAEQRTAAVQTGQCQCRETRYMHYEVTWCTIHSTVHSIRVHAVANERPVSMRCSVSTRWRRCQQRPQSWTEVSMRCSVATRWGRCQQRRQSWNAITRTHDRPPRTLAIGNAINHTKDLHVHLHAIVVCYRTTRLL